MKFDAPLKLTEDGDIAFDFPEKPKPIETNVLCPKCGRPLKKTQWKYECECGFNVWHTVAKVELFRGNSHGAVYYRKDQKEGHRLHLQGGKCI